MLINVQNVMYSLLNNMHIYREVHVCMLIISKSNYNNVSIIISIEFFCEMIWPDSQIINIYTFNTKSVSHIIANLSN